MFHREDEPLIRLFLDDEQTAPPRPPLGRAPLHQPAAGGREQVPAAVHRLRDAGPAEGTASTYFEGQRPAFRKRAEEFEKEVEAADPEAAGRAARLRRPGLSPAAAGEGEDRPARLCTRRCARRACRTRKRSAACWPACWSRRRSCSASSRPPPGKEPGPVNDWELATRLSYFLWSSLARRRAAPARRRGPAPRPEGAGRADPADAQGRPRCGRWRSSSARSGFTSAASTNSRRRTRSCSRRSTPTCARRSTRNRSCSSRICSRTTGR